MKKDGFPKVVSSEYGDKIGGSMVDAKFVELIKKVTGFDQLKIPVANQSQIIFDLLR